ncbi:GFA family protein [Marinomonas rhizomae]|uniref:GFA family protein n=1 Tax=Marinomonas rhizomae TaxID=491948 RepID=UPI0021063EF8|nr:GFA family protein [Marinomonas rhizomae]UTW00801.1 GFA family protein [Marinomonas rhizomae]
MITFKGGCLCQAVRYETTAEPLNQRVCHCHECQKAIGAAFNARVLMRIDDVSITGSINTYYSSETLERGSCSHCGSSVFSRRASAGVIGLTVGSMDDSTLFKPDMHFWVSSKQPWLELTDGLPQHLEAPPSKGY